jgi:hypothetical protein
MSLSFNARPVKPRDRLWYRGRAAFEAGRIALDLTTLQTYSPTEHRGTVWEFAAIRRPQDAVDFARRHGLLRRPPPDAVELSEPWEEWERESLHVHSILVTVTQLRAAEHGDAEAMDYLREIAATPAWREMWLSRGAEREARKDEERRAQFGVWIAEQVSDGLRDVPHGIASAFEFLVNNGKPGSPGSFLYAPSPPDLMGWIYDELAQVLIEGRPARRCEGCGVMFLVTDERQRYHDKRCAQRARYHRAAEKRRQQA